MSYDLEHAGDIFVKPEPPKPPEVGTVYLSTDGQQRWEWNGYRWERDWTHEPPDKLPGWFMTLLVFAAIVGFVTLNNVFGELVGQLFGR
jgi:hypothetical protein